jgi:hypothetical protein
LLGAAAQPNNPANFPLGGGCPPTLAASRARSGSSLPEVRASLAEVRAALATGGGKVVDLPNPLSARRVN